MSKGLQDATKEMFDYMDKGLTAKEARAVVKPQQVATRQADYKLQQKYTQYSLTAPKIVQQASKVYENALKGKKLTRNSDDKPSNSQVLQVAKEVMDRQHPKVTINQNLNVNVDLDPVDLADYLNVTPVTGE